MSTKLDIEQKFTKHFESAKMQIKNKRVFIVLSFVFFCSLLLLNGYIYFAKAKEVKEDYVVVIDAGHGGNDPGKVGVHDVLEKDINLQIALRLRDVLQKKGVTVIMTREDDGNLSDSFATNKKTSDLNHRVEIMNNSQADCVISIHQNSFSDEAVHGAQVFFHKESEEGKLLAQNIQDAIKKSVDKNNNKKIKAGNDYFIVKNSVSPCVIVECGFLSNGLETDNLMDEMYQEKMANAIADAVVTWCKK